MKFMERGSVMLLAAVLLGATDAGAYFAGGGKDAAKGNDCLIGYDNVDPDQVTLDGKKQIVTCTDCDPSCDVDNVTTANGSCTIQIGACINQSGVTGCDPPSALSKASAKAKVKGVKGASGKIVIDVSQLLEGSACGALVDALIPIKETNKGAKDGKATFKLSGSVKKNKAEGIVGRSDKDKLTYVCAPRAEGEACPIPTTTTSSSTSTTFETSTTSTSTTTSSTTTSSTTTSTTTTSSTTTSSTLGTTSTTVATTSTTSTTVASTSTTSTTVPSSTTSTTTPSTTSTTVPPSTTTTSTTIPPPTSTSTTTVPTTTTTTTTAPPTIVPMRFTTVAAGGTCGETRTGGAGGTIIKTLTCGGLNVGGGCFQGGGACGVPEGPTPAGADTFFTATCSSGSCSVSARTSAETGSSNNCSDTGCKFGPPLSIANGGTSTCVLNTFAAPGSGTLTTPGGDFTGSIPLTSTVTVTGNAANPCPSCVGGICDGTASNPGAACTAINAAGDSYECLPAGIGLTPFGVNLSPVSTNTESVDTTSGGNPGVFCPGQDGVEPGSFGCFDSGPSTVCDYIEERGADAVGLTDGGAGVPGTLASIFCIPATGNGLIDGAADLPGPGAVTLPGTFELN